MISLVTLAVFSGAVLLLLLSPGPNMAFVISHGVTHGWRGGCASALGIAVADLLLTALTAMGVTALVASWPPAFDLTEDTLDAKQAFLWRGSLLP